MLLSALVLVLADTGVAVPGPPRACGADSMYTRVPVYLRVTVARAADTTASTSLLVIAEAVAERIRVSLGGVPNLVPRGDTLSFVPRRDSARAPVWLGGMDSTGVHVVARRDGTLRWSPIQGVASPATAVLARALADAKAADEAFIPPRSFTADSMPFTLNYVGGFDVAGERVVAREAGPPSLVAFTMRTGRQKLAAAVPGTLRVRYPDVGFRMEADARAVLRFVVDTTGLVADSTVHDVWPTDRPRLTGHLGDYYNAFVRAATESVLRARFYPAEIAGCKVRQLVQQSFTWTMERRPPPPKPYG